MEYVDFLDDYVPPDTKPNFILVDAFHEHGPLWIADKKGKPLINNNNNNNNNIVYPMHRWIARDNNSFDVWIAVEFNPTLV